MNHPPSIDLLNTEPRATTGPILGAAANAACFMNHHQTARTSFSSGRDSFSSDTRPEEEEQEPQEHAEEGDNKGRPSSFFSSSSSSSSALPVKDGIRQQDILPGRGKVDHRTYYDHPSMWLAGASMTRSIDGSDCLLSGRPTEKFVLFLRK
jgi:hypothetical protein